MKQIDIKDWSTGIGKYIEKYMAYIYDLQQERKTNGMSKEYVKLKRICEDMKSEISNCINKIDSYDFLPHE